MIKSEGDTNNELSSIFIKDDSEPMSSAQVTLNSFWPSVMDDIKRIKLVDAKNQQLPLARIKKIMKLDDEVKMISAEAPLLFAKAAEIFIHELTLMAWVFTEENKRRTLQRSDIAMAISKYDQFDFLIDIVPREEIKTLKKEAQQPASPGAVSTEQKLDSNTQIQCYLQLAQQHRQALQSMATTTNLENSGTVLTQVATPTVQNQLTAVAGNIVTQQNAIPLATLLQQQQPTQTIQTSSQPTAIQQNQQQTHQILNNSGTIAFSAGQNIILQGTSPQQAPQTAQILTAGGQIIGGLPQTSPTNQPNQQQFHVIQQIISPTGEIQHIQIPISANQLGVLRMQNAQTQPQILLQNMPQGQFIQMGTATSAAAQQTHHIQSSPTTSASTS